MNYEEKKIAIAKACGWSSWPSCKYAWVWNKGPMPKAKYFSKTADLPDYPRDLNDMHEAEKILTPEQRDDYVERLSPTGTSRCPHSTFAVLHATADQRAVAFLKTLGKWVGK